MTKGFRQCHSRYTKALDSIKSLRKDRLADLKAEKERLSSLSLQKTHHDKLSSRISSLNSTIAQKELEYEENKKAWDDLVRRNSHFQEMAAKFREIFGRIEELQKAKSRIQEDLAEARVNVTHVEGTEKELEAKVRNFDEDLAEQKGKRRSLASEQEGLEDDLSMARREHVELLSEHGVYTGEAKAQEGRLSERQDLINEIARKHNISGFASSPLSREQVITFKNRLEAIQSEKAREYERVQTASKNRDAEYHKRVREMQVEVEGSKQRRSAAAETIVRLLFLLKPFIPVEADRYGAHRGRDRKASKTPS